MIRVGILGGGHIGLALAALLGAREDCRVRMWGRSVPQSASLRIDAWASATASMPAHLCARAEVQACDTPEAAIADADLVVLAVPAHARSALLRPLAPALADCRLLLVWEGSGRLAETVDALDPRPSAIVGLQRSPLLCRAAPAPQAQAGAVRGRRTVRILGVRDSVVAACLRGSDTAYARRVLRALLPVRLQFAPDYACVRLSPGNPLTHPARLYACASARMRAGGRGTRFYADWDDAASRALLALHGELAGLRDARGLSRRHLRTLTDATRPWTPAALTRITREATALREVRLPLCPVEQGGGMSRWNTDHRFFAEDIGEGLATILADADAAGVAMPTASAIVGWYRGLVAGSGASAADASGAASC